MHPQKQARYRLEVAYVLALCTHGLGLVTMALLVVPGMPGGLVPPLERARYVASHPWLWKLGWLPWQLSAVADLGLAWAWWGMRTLPTWLRALVVLLTVAGVLPDQYGQLMWTTHASAVAARSVALGDAGSYVAFERPLFELVCMWASAAYTVLAVLWTLGLQRLGLASLAFVRYSWALWSFSGICLILLLLPAALQPPVLVQVLCNAAFFAGLMGWFAWVVGTLLVARIAGAAY
jgi:hypothetical protein